MDAYSVRVRACKYTSSLTRESQRETLRCSPSFLEKGAFQFYYPPWYDLDNEILRGTFRPPSELHSPIIEIRVVHVPPKRIRVRVSMHDRGTLANPRVTRRDSSLLFSFHSRCLRFLSFFCTRKRGSTRRFPVVYNSSVVDENFNKLGRMTYEVANDSRRKPVRNSLLAVPLLYLTDNV